MAKKTFEDQCLHSLPILVDKIYQENERQVEKWGIQECTPAEWMLFATEEVGELAGAIAEHEYRGAADKEEIVKEAIQAATLILKIAEMYL
jgi:NTP pyrophosphatase (non-canonical NTP hydrolase)